MLFLFGMLILTGCQNQEAENIRNEDHVVYVKDPGERQQEDLSGQEIAEHLSDIASRVPNVNDATAVVVGPYTVVGVDVNAELDRSRVGSIKYSVAESLRHDPYGRKAVVVADPDTFDRLNQMASQIRQGNPGKGFMDELAAIVGRVMPQIPSDINSNKSEVEQNKKQLPKNEQQELDQVQKKQSGNRMD